MAQLQCYCGDAKEQETCHGSLRVNFRTHKHIFHDNTDQVQYLLDHLGSWAYQTDSDMQKTTMIDPITCCQDLQMNKSTCLDDFDLFVWEIQMMYGDQNGRLNAVRKSSYNCLQCLHKTNWNIEAYANRLQWNWREGEWDEVQFQQCCTTWSGRNRRPTY